MASKIRMARPTDPALRDADVERKLQLYGIAKAFSAGKMPTNEQIDVALNSFRATDFMDPDSSWNRKLSDDGRVLVKDFATVVDKAKVLVLVKNYDNLFQEFVWHSAKMSDSSDSIKKSVSSDPNDKDNATLYENNDVIKGLKDLGTLIITNGQFRKLLSDAVTLLRDMASDAGSKATDFIRPDQEKLDQLDEPAPDDTWHDTPDTTKLNQAKGLFNKTKDNSAGGVKQNLANLKDEHQDKVNQANEVKDKRIGQAKDYLDSKVPKERRDQIILRLKKMVVEIQGHQDYQNAVDSLLDLAENYRGYANDAAAKGSSKAKKVGENDHLQQAQGNLKLLIERFANNSSLDDLIDVFNDLYADANNDPVLKGWFQNLDTYIRKALKQKGYILTDGATTDFNELSDRGREIFKNNYKDYGPRFNDEFTYLLNQFAEDPLNKDFGDAMNTLFVDLGTDGSGNTVFKKSLVKDITNVILPELFENIRYVPLPRIEYTDNMIDAVVENLIVESSNLMPNLVEIRNHSMLRWGRQSIESKKSGSFMVHCSGIQCDLKDVSYYVHKKTGFPSIKDTGIADLFLGYEGFSFKLALSTVDSALKSRNKFFKVDSVNVSIKHLNVKLKKSKHKILFAFFKPLLISVMKPALKVILEKQIRSTFNDLDETAYQIHLEKKRMATDYRNSGEKMPSKIQLYVNATKSELLRQKQMKGREREAKGKTEKGGKANIAMTQEDSILKHIVLPTGISSTKATKYSEMARQGDRWKSPVFSIGSAAPSKEFSMPVDITRKAKPAQPLANTEIVNSPPSDRSTRGNTQAYSTAQDETKASGSTGITASIGSFFTGKKSESKSDFTRSDTQDSNDDSGHVPSTEQTRDDDFAGQTTVAANDSTVDSAGAQSQLPGSYGAGVVPVIKSYKKTVTTIGGGAPDNTRTY